jgi:hypothetical protein
MSWNRNRFNREDDDRDYGSRGRGRQWNRDFDQMNTQNTQNTQNQGRGFEGDYGYGRDFDYERGSQGMNQGMGSGSNMGNQGQYYGGTDYGRGMGNDFYERGNYGQGHDFGRGNRGDWSSNPNFGYDRQNDWNQGSSGRGGQFSSGYNRDYDYGSGSPMNQGQLRGGWPRGGDYDYSSGYGGGQEGDWSGSSTRQNYGQGYFGGGRSMGQSRNWGQGQPDTHRDFGQGRGFGDYDYGQSQSSFGRGSRGQGGFGGGFGGGQNRPWNQGPHSGRGPQGWQRSEERIREDVHEALTNHGWLDASNIQVEVKNGMVTLTGTVESRYAKRMAEDALDNVPGVNDVQNNLRVQTGDEGTTARNESFSGVSGSAQGTGTSSGSSGRSSGSGSSGTTNSTTNSTSNRTKERSTT